MSLSLNAAAYHDRVLAFAEDCAAAQQGASGELEVG
jgi:hypothetical protein